MSDKKDLNKTKEEEKDMKKDELITLVVIFILILIGSYYLGFNIFYVIFGLLLIFVIIYFRKEISRLFLL